MGSSCALLVQLVLFSLGSLEGYTDPVPIFDVLQLKEEAIIVIVKFNVFFLPPLGHVCSSVHKHMLQAFGIDS